MRHGPRLASVPAPLRRRLARLARRVRDGGPVASVLVLLSGDLRAVRRTVESVCAQSVTGLDIVLVAQQPDLAGFAAERARDDSRIRVIAAEGDDTGAARRAGLTAVRAPYVLVLGPGAELLPQALAALLEPGAGIVLGDLAGEADDDLVARYRTPLLARLLVPVDRLRALTGLPDDADGSVAALRLIEAGVTRIGIPVLRDTATVQGPFVDRVDPWPELDRRIEADVAGLRLIGDRADAAAQRAAGIVSRDLAGLLEYAELAGPAAWGRFADHVRMLLDRADPALIGVETRVRAWLAATGREPGRHEALTRFVAERRFARGLATEVRDGEVRAVLPELDPAGPLPDRLLVLGPAETRLRARLSRVQERDGRLCLELQAGIEHVASTGVSADLELIAGERRIPVPVRVLDDPAVTRWLAEPLTLHHTGRLVAELPAAELPDGSWRLELRLTASGITRTGRVRERDARGSAMRRTLAVGERRVTPGGGSDGVTLTVSPGPVEPPAATEAATDLLLGQDRLEVALDADGGEPSLAGPGSRLPGVPLGAGRWRFELTADPWRLGERPAPNGNYRLELAGRPVRVAERLLDRLPQELPGPAYRITAGRGAGGALQIRLDPPLADDEAGPFAQARLRARYLQVSEPLDPDLVYFQSFTGKAATDHPFAIQQELARRAPHARIRWLVDGSSAPVPTGAEPVQVRSREWYDVLARASYLVTNIDLDRWFRRRDGQELLQTYHGYPSKRMGIEQWRARGLPPSRIEQDLRRSSGTWTALLTPQPDADRYYREQYAYQGRILALGYPRDDLLVGPQAAPRRAETRTRLGVGQAQRVLLYAPTWRDDLATNFRVAAADHHLDLGTLARSLGPEWVLLLRGHRFHASVGSTGSQILDVTDYPEVNDLILAADSAVLDYSSLRFDFALTGRPAVYLVPDLAHYTGKVRGFLQDYRSTAPGPLVESTAEVAAELADFDAFVSRWSEPVARFNATFNTRQDGAASARVVEAFFGPLLER